MDRENMDFDDLHQGRLTDPTPWANRLSKEDLAIFDAAGYGSRGGMGSTLGVLVVDTTYRFVGSRPLPILEAVAECRTSCGYAGWDAVRNIRILLDAARRVGIPIFYSKGPAELGESAAGTWSSKNRRAASDVETDLRLDAIVSELAPHPADVVVEKRKPSAFFGSTLESQLRDAGIDGLICVGGTTSGCVRASVVDAFSYDFYITVVHDCVFDRSDLVHEMNLFDINAKYGDVVGLDSVLSRMAALR